MARSANNLKAVLTDTANAIKTKKGSNSNIIPRDFADEISSIQTGTDTSDATATANDILLGKTAYVDNVKISGNIPTKTQNDLEVSGATVTTPSGYYATSASKSVASGSVSVGNSSFTANPTISVNTSTGVVSASVSGSTSVSPTVSAGYVSSGTSGTISVSGSATQNLNTLSATTYTPGTVDQTIPSGQFLTGTQTIKGDANLIADNIKKDVSIFGVTGSYEASGGDTGLTVVQTGDTITFEVVSPASESANYVKFSSPNSFTLGVSNSGTLSHNGTVEYSTDNSTWNSWDCSSTIASASDGTTHNVYLRGTNNTYFKAQEYSVGSGSYGYNGFIFSGSNISVSGQMEALLDYQTVANGGHPTMSNSYAHEYLFSDCSNLVDASGLILGAETLTTYCYDYMFSGCSSLTTPPELPATTLASYCYRCMFYDCTSLTTLPKLNATTLATGCYLSMFSTCSNIKLSTTQTGVYQYEYRIPTTGTGTSDIDSLKYMFTSTGGTFTGTPTINTTYYTDHEPI